MPKVIPTKTATLRRGRKYSTATKPLYGDQKTLPDEKSILTIDKKVTTKFKYRKKLPKKVIDQRNRIALLQSATDGPAEDDSEYTNVKIEKGSASPDDGDIDILESLECYTHDVTPARTKTKILTEIPPINIKTEPMSFQRRNTRKVKSVNVSVTRKKAPTTISKSTTTTATRKCHKPLKRERVVAAKKGKKRENNLSENDSNRSSDEYDIFGTSETWEKDKNKRVKQLGISQDGDGNDMDTFETNPTKTNSPSSGSSKLVVKNTPYANKPKLKESKNCEKVGKTIKDLPSIIKNSVNTFAVDECENAIETLKTIETEIVSIRKLISTCRLLECRKRLGQILDILTDDIGNVDEMKFSSMLDGHISKSESWSWCEKRMNTLETRVEYFDSLFEKLAQQYSIDKMRLHATIMPQITGSIHYADRIVGIAAKDLKIFTGTHNPHYTNEPTSTSNDSDDNDNDIGTSNGLKSNNNSLSDPRLYVDSQELQEYQDCFSPNLTYPNTNALRQHILSSRTNKPHKKRKKLKNTRRVKQTDNSNIITELPIKVFSSNLLAYPFG